MNYYSTQTKNLRRTLREAVLDGLAPDGGLFMPEKISVIPDEQMKTFPGKSFLEISQEVAINLFLDDLPEQDILEITSSAISFDTPLVKVKDGIYSLD